MNLALIEYYESDNKTPVLWVWEVEFHLKNIKREDYEIVSENVVLFINELKELSSDILNEREIIDKRIIEIEHHWTIKFIYDYLIILLNSITIWDNKFQEKLDKMYYLLSNIAKSSIELDKYINNQEIEDDELNNKLLELSKLYNTSFEDLLKLMRWNVFINELYYDLYDIDYNSRYWDLLNE